MPDIPTARMTSKGQITIPKAVREKLNLKPGDRVRFEVEGTRAARITAINRSLDEIVGMLKPYTNVRLEAEEIKEKARDAAAKDVVRSLEGC